MSSPQTNIEFLRKEAKSLLKSCRSGLPAAISRVRAALPRFAQAPEEDVRATIQLSDVQYALARECGVLNWSDLKRVSQPGSNGIELPEGFNPWGWCLSYTVRPEILAPLRSDREYRIFTRVIRRPSNVDDYRDFADLYARARAIADGRLARLKCEHGKVVRSRILAQGWWLGQRTQLATAYLGIGVSCLDEKDPIPKGEDVPTEEELTRPGGMTPEKAASMPPDSTVKVLDESYTDADGRDTADSMNTFIVSYGEYVQTCEGLDYQPFIKRAEELAKFHRPFLESKSKVVRREWFSVVNPNIVVVHVYLRLC